jgi:hypothetical protein
MSCGMCRPGLAPLGRRFPDKSKKGARKVGLVGEATFERNLVKWSIRCQQETLGPLHPAQHYEAVWRTAKAARECPRKVPRTQAYQAREVSNSKRSVKIRLNMNLQLTYLPRGKSARNPAAIVFWRRRVFRLSSDRARTRERDRACPPKHAFRVRPAVLERVGDRNQQVAD